MSENQTTPAQENALPAELTIVDLQNLKAIIEVASKRGAFAANEMAAVGGVYNKLEAFVTAATPAEQPAPADATAPQ